MTITQAGWIAYAVDMSVIAKNTLNVKVLVQNVENPRQELLPGTALYAQLMADAMANPSVSGYTNPIPPTVLYPGEIAGFAIPQIYLYVYRLTQP